MNAALRELGGNYILNGPSGLNSSGSFEASGTIFTYSRPNSHGGDHLYARGPTLHSLDIMVSTTLLLLLLLFLYLSVSLW